MIDNFDSFVYNLKAYFQELGREILVKRCDEITLEELEELNPEGIILSPGPKRPWDAELCVEAVKRFQGRIPILGVCLGHQVLGHCAGAVVEKGSRPMHGKVTEIRNYGTGVFADKFTLRVMDALRDTDDEAVFCFKSLLDAADKVLLVESDFGKVDQNGIVTLKFP